MSSTSPPPAAWYPDPAGGASERYWDGRSWTDHTRAPAPPQPPPAPITAEVPVVSAVRPPVLIGPTPTPTRRSRRGLAIAAVAVVALVAGGVVGWERTTNRSTAGSSDERLDTTQIVDAISVTNQDAPGMGLVEIGDQIGTTGVSLDLCLANFPSESLRIRRHQVAVGTQADGSVLSTEALVYRSPGAATQATRELRNAAKTCPSTPRTASDGSVETTRITVPPSGPWHDTPGVTELRYRVVETLDDGTTNDAIRVYLVRGRVLLALYFGGTTVPSAIAGSTSIPDISRVFAQRVAALPASAVGG